MKLSENQKNYEPLIIPLDKPIEELSKQEAKEYFDWFISHVDERAEYVRRKASEGLNIPIEPFSADSLKLIWRWFLQVAEISKTPKKVLRQMEKSMRGQPQSFINHMLEQSSEELSVFTEYVLRDIGMYLAKVFLTNFSSIGWRYKTHPKTDVFVNTPLLSGFYDFDYDPPFQIDFDPVEMARIPALKIFESTQNENDLFNLYCSKWVEWIPKETE